MFKHQLQHSDQTFPPFLKFPLITSNNRAHVIPTGLYTGNIPFNVLILISFCSGILYRKPRKEFLRRLTSVTPDNVLKINLTDTHTYQKINITRVATIILFCNKLFFVFKVSFQFKYIAMIFYHGQSRVRFYRFYL